MKSGQSPFAKLRIGLAFALLCGMAFLADRAARGLYETTSYVEQTHVVIESLDELSIALLDAQLARRGHALTGEQETLGPYHEAVARSVRQRAALRRLMSDNPAQLARLDALEPKVDALIALLSSGIEGRAAEGFQLEREAARTMRGEREMGDVRGVVGEMIAEERRLLAQREEQTRSSMRWTTITLVVSTLVSGLLLALAFAALYREIRHRTAAEQARARAGEFLDSIVENIPHMIFVKDAETLLFRRMNRAGEELLGLRREELLGKNDYDFFPDEQAEHFQRKDRETLAGSDVVEIVEEIDAAAGKRWLQTKKVPVRDAAGRPEFLLGISEDITERKRAAEEVREARDRAEAANRELEAFSYAVSHDLRAPLRAIDGFSRAIEDDWGDRLGDEAKRDLGRVRAATRRMSDLIDCLLQLSRLSRAPIKREDVDFSAIASAVAEERRAEAGTRRVTFVIDPDLRAQADPRLTRVILDNLIGNAVKFTAKKDAATIRVGAEETERGRAFFVRDDGVGFDMAYASKLFIAFQRLHGQQEFDGLGIGLATVQRAVVRQGGEVWATGEIEKGATFYFTFGTPLPETILRSGTSGEHKLDVHARR